MPFNKPYLVCTRTRGDSRVRRAARMSQSLLCEIDGTVVTHRRLSNGKKYEASLPKEKSVIHPASVSYAVVFFQKLLALRISPLLRRIVESSAYSQHSRPQLQVGNSIALVTCILHLSCFRCERKSHSLRTYDLESIAFS
jgi:hypothetical protein